MTENDQRLTKTLTEGADAPGKARAYQCPLSTSVYGCPCIQTHREYGHCYCLNCVTARYWRVASSAEQSSTKEERNQWEPYLERHQRLIDDATEHVTLAEEITRKRTLHQQNKANALSKLGPWEFTLTYSPTQHGWDREEAKEAMRTAIARLTRYYRAEIREFHAVGELTESGAPHVHAWYMLEGGRKMTTKSFQRAYPIWNEKRKLGRGHEGGHHEPIKRTADFAGYIEKDLDTSWLVTNITNEPAEAQAHVPQEDDHPSSDGTPGSPTPAEPHDG